MYQLKSKKQSVYRLIISVLFIFFCSGICVSQKKKQAAIVTGNQPFTSLPFNDDTTKLQFGIISDLWGGRRPGIFEDAVSKLELLQPQFVMSVGDLIDGKTYDPVSINRQWDEFDSLIQPLTMPFFYVPGNHDIGNPAMENEWKKRLGAPYYYFIHKNVLFMCINTEDGGHGGISDEQVAYFRKAIEVNDKVRWTFLFMHRPVWQGKNNKQEGYEKIEAVLRGRNYTLFSGHHHTYLSLVKNGHKHFVLGSTGGGSDLRGEKFGEFDHLTLVTLAEGEPKIVNLKLDGIIKEDVVNEEVHSITETLIDQKWLTVIPQVSEVQKTREIKAKFILENPTRYTLNVSGVLDSTKKYYIKPDRIALTLEPGKHITREIRIFGNNDSLIDLNQIQSIKIMLQGEYLYKGISYSLPASKDLLLNWKYVVQPVRQSFDSFLQGNSKDSLIDIARPEYLNGPWYWSGEKDCRLQFNVVQDAKFIYIRTLLLDDQWTDIRKGDMMYLYIEDSGSQHQVIELAPGDKKIEIKGAGAINFKNLSVTTSFNKQLLAAEFRIPRVIILKKDHSLRINIGYRDQDNIPEQQVSTLFWKPLWQSGSDYLHSGTFIVK